MKTSKAIAIAIVAILAIKVATSVMSVLLPSVWLILAGLAIWYVFIREDNSDTV